MKTRRTILKAVVAAGFVATAGLGATGAASADELEALKEKGSMRIAMSGAYPPFNFVNEQNARLCFTISQCCPQRAKAHKFANGRGFLCILVVQVCLLQTTNCVIAIEGVLQG